jgi:Icc protein
VSWRFKPLEAALPFVLITRPTDRRLATEASRVDAGSPLVRAKVIGDAPIMAVQMQADDGEWTPMRPGAGGKALWEASGPANLRHVTVRARDAKDRLDEDRIEPAGDGWTAPVHQADGSDADRIKAWPERGIFGNQLGPNRNGRKW